MNETKTTPTTTHNEGYRPHFVVRKERIDALETAHQTMLAAAIQRGEGTIVQISDKALVHDSALPILQRCLVCGGHDGPSGVIRKRNHPAYGRTLEQSIDREVEHRPGCDVLNLARELKRLKGFQLPNWAPINEFVRRCIGIAEWATRTSTPPAGSSPEQVEEVRS